MYYFKKLDGYIYGKDVNSPEGDTDVLLTQEEVDARNQVGIDKALKRREDEKFIKKVKSLLIDKFEDVSKEEMIEFTAAFNEHSVLGQVKIERYPLVAAQIQEWTTQGLI